nr:EthD family reductase [Salinirubrum litoreum]
MTHAEFADYWLDEHSPVAAEMPGVEKYVTSLPTDPEKAEYDGVLELYFADMDALRAAFDSEAGAETLADAEEFLEVGAGPRMIVEETVQVDTSEE